MRLWILDAGTAFSALLSMLMFPAALMLGLGLLFWYRGHLQQDEERLRLGRLLTMLGAIFLGILLITSNFLLELLARAARS